MGMDVLLVLHLKSYSVHHIHGTAQTHYLGCHCNGCPGTWSPGTQLKLTSPHVSNASLVSSVWRLWRLSLDKPLAFLSSSWGGLRRNIPKVSLRVTCYHHLNMKHVNTQEHHGTWPMGMEPFQWRLCKCAKLMWKHRPHTSAVCVTCHAWASFQ